MADSSSRGTQTFVAEILVIEAVPADPMIITTKFRKDDGPTQLVGLIGVFLKYT